MLFRSHFHSVLFGGFLFPLIAGIYYWFPKMTGHRMNEKLGRAQWCLMTLGSALLILPMFVLGLDGLRRRTADYSNMDFRPLVITTAVGGFLIFLGLLVLFYNILSSRRKGAPAGDNPWEGRTLEWMTSSPPPDDNFLVTPVVTGEPYDYGITSEPYAVFTGANPSKNS